METRSGQKALEKMLNITNHQRNANQKYNKIAPPHPLGELVLEGKRERKGGREGGKKEEKKEGRKEITSVGNNVEKLKLLCTVGGGMVK